MSKTMPAPSGIDTHVDLDVIGAIAGADKSSSFAYGWDYLRHYERAFADFRRMPINLIEVGVAGGASLRVWKWFFPAAHIIGVDINPACARLAQDRVSIEIGSQADTEFLSRVCASHPPTIFIDDGSHLAEHNIITFEHVFPLLAPGGIYVVEDMAFHFGAWAERWQTAQQRSSPEYFLDLARSCLARRATPGTETVPGPLFDMVDQVDFIGGAVIIRKRHAARAFDRAVAVGRDYIGGRKMSERAWQRLAGYILAHDASLQEADACCEAAMAAGGRTLESLVLKMDILLRQGRRASALAVMEEAMRLPDGSLHACEMLARLQIKTGLKDAAKATLSAMLVRDPNHGPARRLLARMEGMT